MGGFGLWRAARQLPVCILVWQLPLLYHPCHSPSRHAPPPYVLQGTLTWTNSGSLGGGGETKLTARMKLDKDSMQQVCFGGGSENLTRGGRWGGDLAWSPGCIYARA